MKYILIQKKNDSIDTYVYKFKYESSEIFMINPPS